MRGKYQKTDNNNCGDNDTLKSIVFYVLCFYVEVPYATLVAQPD